MRRHSVGSAWSLVIHKRRTRLENSDKQTESAHERNELNTEGCSSVPFFSESEKVPAEALVRGTQIYDFDLFLMPGVLFMKIAHMLSACFPGSLVWFGKYQDELQITGAFAGI
jgi:hypothetical protein